MAKQDQNGIKNEFRGCQRVPLCIWMVYINKYSWFFEDQKVLLIRTKFENFLKLDFPKIPINPWVTQKKPKNGKIGPKQYQK